MIAVVQKRRLGPRLVPEVLEQPAVGAVYAVLFLCQRKCFWTFWLFVGMLSDVPWADGRERQSLSSICPRYIAQHAHKQPEGPKALTLTQK